MRVWEWLNINGKLLPKPTNKQSTPDSLLKTIVCNCTGDCSTVQSGCRKGGNPVSSVCGICQLQECTNVDISYEESEYDIDTDFTDL